MSNESTEKKFRKSLSKLNSNIWIRKLRVDFQNTPFDYLVLTENYNYAFEIKEWKNDSYFYLERRVAPHQIAGLKNFEKLGTRFKAFILIRIIKKGFDSAYKIPIELYISYLRRVKKFNKDLFIEEFDPFKIAEKGGLFILSLG